MAAGYSVKKNNLVVIWLDSEDTPGNLEQPHWPDGTAWASKKEAEDWAKAWLAHNADETKPMPGNGPDAATIPTPTAEEAEAAREAAIAEITAAEAKAAADAEAAKIDQDALDAAERAKTDAVVAEPAAE
jgi:hypothetical protein